MPVSYTHLDVYKRQHQENATDAHKAAAMEVTGTGASTFGAHRADAKVGEYEEDAV